MLGAERSETARGRCDGDEAVTRNEGGWMPPPLLLKLKTLPPETSEGFLPGGPP